MSTSNNIPAPGSHPVTLAYAIQLTSRYRNNRELVLAPSYKGQEILALSETFNKQDLELLLAQPEAAAVRIYFGMSDSLKVHAVLVAVNSSNEDILQAQSVVEGSGPDVILQEGQRCPVICPPPSPLNT